MLTLIVVGLVLWGLFVAAGTIVYGLNPLSAVVVLACVGVFIGFWMLLLHFQKRPKN
jgi:hypothetical protein